MVGILKRISRNKKKFLHIFFFFVLAVSLPFTAYFIDSDRSFDERGRAWWDIDFEKDRPGWTEIDFDEDESQESDPAPLPSEETVSITSFDINPSEVEEGGTITVSWSSSGATSCILNRGGETRDAPTSASRTDNITLSPGTYIYTLTCQNNSGVQDSATQTLRVTEAGNGGVNIDSFTINPSEVEEGGTITVSWSSSGATSCILERGGETRDAPTSASRTDNITLSSGTYIYTLTCQNNSGVQDSATQTLTVIEPDTEPECGSHHGEAFSFHSSSWPSGSFCSVGQPDPSNPKFPEPGETTSWICAEGSSSVSCLAGREETSIKGECEADSDCRREAPYEICFENMCLRGDVNDDGDINMTDFSEFRKDFISFKERGWSNTLRRSDFNQDDRISMADYSIYVRSYRLVNALDSASF